MILQPKEAPELEPVELAEVEGQLRIGDLSEESETVDIFIKAVRELCESTTNRALVTQQWELKLDNFPPGRTPIEIPKPPLQKIDSIKYVDLDGVTQTLNPLSYRIIGDTGPTCQPSKVIPMYGTQWPVALSDFETVTITFTCGYGPIDPDTDLNIPASIKQWILLNISNLYEHRETIQVGNRLTVIELGTIADSLLNNYRIRKL